MCAPRLALTAHATTLSLQTPQQRRCVLCKTPRATNSVSWSAADFQLDLVLQVLAANLQEVLESVLRLDLLYTGTKTEINNVFNLN